MRLPRSLPRGRPLAEPISSANAGLFGGTTGTGAPRFTSFTGGKSPIWNQYGHERMGWALSTSNPPAP